MISHRDLVDNGLGIKINGKGIGGTVEAGDWKLDHVVLLQFLQLTVN